MPTFKLKEEYKRLRSELERAYSSPVWNSVQIDRIANALADIEKTFMRCNAVKQSLQSIKPPTVRQHEMTQA